MDIFGITGARDILTDAVFWLCVSWCVCVCVFLGGIRDSAG